MKRGGYKLVFWVYVMTISLIAIFAFLVGNNITGYVIISPENCDLNISCGYDNWTSGMFYCLNESQMATDVCFNITNDDIALDLQEFDIDGSGAPASADGIIVNGYDHVVIGNGNIYNFDVGVFINSSFSSLIVDLVVHDNNAGILLQSSDANSISDIVLYDNNDGISFRKSNENSLTTVSSYDNTNGIVFLDSNNSVVFNISLYNNNDSLLLLNSIDGVFSNMEVYDNLNDGIYANSVSGSTFEDISSYNNLNDGLVFLNSRTNSFSQVSSNNNSASGFRLLSSDMNSFVDVDSYNNGLEGFYLDSADTNSFIDVSSYDNQRGIYMNFSDANVFSDLVLSNNSLNSSIGTNLSLNSFYHNVSDKNWIKWELGNNLSFSGGLDFGSNIEFGTNYVNVNSSSLPSTFNSLAIVSLDLSGTDITAPRLFVDGASCETNLCNIASFENDVISFIVKHFTNYSFEQSTCGDSYCSIGEDCSLCASDCGNCSEEDIIIVVIEPDFNESGVGAGSGAGQDQSSTGTNATGDDDDDDLEFPWIWVYVGLGVIVFLGIFLVIALFILRNKGDSIVITVEKPKPLSQKIKKVFSGGASTAAPVKPVPVSNVNAKKPVDFAHDVSSIRDYVQTVSRDPRVRIRYLIDSGKKFVERRDYKNAKEIYGFIFEEYKNLKRNDEKLYWEIVRFRMMIR